MTGFSAPYNGAALTLLATVILLISNTVKGDAISSGPVLCVKSWPCSTASR